MCHTKQLLEKHRGGILPENFEDYFRTTEYDIDLRETVNIKQGEFQYRGPGWVSRDTLPFSGFHSEYGEDGTCQNQFVICPYCGHADEEYYSENSGDNVCPDCDMPYQVEASFGYGYTTSPKPCEIHVPIITAQYRHNGDSYRLVDCMACGKTIDYRPNSKKSKRANLSMLPLRPEYLIPEYWDPDGLLDTGRSIEDQIEDRRAHTQRSTTPILDALRSIGDWNSPYKSIRDVVDLMNRMDDVGQA